MLEKHKSENKLLEAQRLDERTRFDLEMLEAAYYSYAMKNAHENVKKTARFITESNTNLGVEKIIQQVIKAKAG